MVAAADVVRAAAEAKGVRLEMDLDPDLGQTVADTDRLRQIVWNLVSNAVRFTPRGGRVSMRAARKHEGIQIQVEDTGMGIPPEHLPHVFERFRQVDGSVTRTYGGLGLGLSIVRHIAEAHGGRVEARSDGNDCGATFTVTLPIPEADALRSIPPARSVSKSGKSGRSTGPRRSLSDIHVLVVDDDPDSLELIEMVLGSAGASVTTAASAREALDASGPFHVILTDIAMPEMDGYAFLRRLRSRATTADIPAIALTAYARQEDAERAIGSGFQEHLKKPVEPGVLLDAVEAWARVSRSKGIAP
jgi:CheY-like chemotaxis protein/anti-sigma regulatory factor (Ser/Thr protein kinase)